MPVWGCPDLIGVHTRIPMYLGIVCLYTMKSSSGSFQSCEELSG